VLGNDARALPVIAIIAAIMIGAAQYLTRSKFGRAMCAIRESEHLAAASGIDAQRTKTLAFAISAIYAAVAGGAYTLFQSFVNADVFSFQQLIFVLSMIIVGGMGSIPGTLIGVVVIGLLPDILRSTMSNVLVWQELVYGVILLFCMMFMPSGIWGLFGGYLTGRKRS
jgi:branched-chain amino acid transport system permease protein